MSIDTWQIHLGRMVGCLLDDTYPLVSCLGYRVLGSPPRKAQLSHQEAGLLISDGNPPASLGMGWQVKMVLVIASKAPAHLQGESGCRLQQQ